MSPGKTGWTWRSRPRCSLRCGGHGRSRTAAVDVAINALREAVWRSGEERGTDGAAAAWHAEPIVRFLCSTFGDAIASVRVREDALTMITGEFPADQPVEATIAVGPEGTCACKMIAGDTHLASTAPDARS